MLQETTISKERFKNISLIFIMTTISLFSLYFVDRVLVKLFVSFAELGYYSAYYNVANLIRIVSGIIPLVVVPLSLSKNYKLTASLAKMSIVLIPIIALIAFISPYIVPLLYGEEYAIKNMLLPWSLGLVSLFLFVYSHANSILVGENNESKNILHLVSIDAVISLIFPPLLSYVLYFYLNLNLSAIPLAVGITLLIKTLLNIKWINNLRNNSLG